MGKDRAAIDAEIRANEERIEELRRRIGALRSERPAEPVEDYALATESGTVRLSEMFAKQRDLVVVHNMGKSCPMCTMWADGFNGILAHLADRFAFVVSSPDAPAVQRAFAESRGWRFRMVSTKGTSFARDLGYENEKGSPLPGVSVFRKQEGRIVRVGHAEFGPLDDYCAIFHLMALTPGGKEWWPKFVYAG